MQGSLTTGLKSHSQWITSEIHSTQEVAATPQLSIRSRHEFRFIRSPRILDMIRIASLFRTRLVTGSLPHRHFCDTPAKPRYGPMPKLTQKQAKRLKTFFGFQADTWVVYSDGSLIKQIDHHDKDTKILSSGFAYLLHGHELRNLQWLDDVDEQNSGYTEIRAVGEALYAVAVSDDYCGQPVELRTDSFQTVEEMGIRCDPLKKRRSVRFEEAYISILEIAQAFPVEVVFRHVYSHNGQPQNTEVDKMAYAAAWLHPRLKHRSPPPRPDVLRKDRKPEFGIQAIVKPKWIK